MPEPRSWLLEKLEGLRAEFADLAFDLECRGRLDAADVAMTAAARVAELREELGAAGLASAPGFVSMTCAPRDGTESGAVRFTR